jgi:class 3 adenylate cyclase/tetratricopeptide (TPR) repeat protein
MAQSGIVTFLFTDLVQSTEHLQRGGDEAGHRAFDAHHKLLTQMVSTNGGEELEWLGDGILAAFSSASDAVRCAIGIQQAARRPAAGARARFEVRIGIHTGEAMRRQGGYFGTPLVVARRLCDRADRGQIFCSKVVQEFLGSRRGFEFRDLGELQLKGLTEPVAVVEVVYERGDPIVLLNRTPFVGRAAQLQRLTAKLEEACNGHGAVAMLLGEPGIGKTRMLEELSELAHEQGAMVLRGACYDGEWQRPFGPFAEVLLDYARKADARELKLLERGAPTLARIAPALRDRLGQIVEPIALEKDEERFRLFDAFSQLLIEVSQHRPLLLVLDDLHWADRGTVAMLSHVAHFVSDNPIFMIGAYRDAEVDRSHPLSGAVTAIRRLRNSESLTLKGLGSADVTELLGVIGDDEPPEALVKALTGETAGNPFFIREVLMHLLEEGRILRDGRGWKMAADAVELGITEGVREVVRQRLRRLSEEANRLLTVGAAFNGAFSFPVTAAVAELEEEAALAAIDEALEAQLLRPGSHPDTFDFTHAIIRHVLYEEMNPARRARWHRRIAEQMERAWGEAAVDHAAEVAYHFWRSAATSGSERGVDYAIAAADNAEAAFAHDQVTAFLRIALELLPRSDGRRPRLLARFGLALPRTLNRNEALEAAQQAAVALETAEGPDAAAEYLEQAARAMFSAGLVPAAWALAKEGLRLAENRRDITWASLMQLDLGRIDAEDPGNPGVLTDTPARRAMRAILKSVDPEQLRVRGIDPPFETRDDIINNPAAGPFTLALMAGEFRTALQLFQQDAGEAERHGRLAKAVIAWSGVAACHSAMGDFTQAQAAIDRAVALNARSAGATSRMAALYLNGVRYQMLIAIDDGWETFFNAADAKALVEDPARENNWSFALVRATTAFVFARLGRADRALSRLATLPRALEVGAFWDVSYGPMICDAAAALWMLNRDDDSPFIERICRERVIAPDFRFPMRDGRLSMARLCALQSRHDEASEWFAKSRTVLEEQGARPLRAIADFDEALMYQRRGKTADLERAHPLIDAALAQFQTLGMKGWVERTRNGLGASLPN